MQLIVPDGAGEATGNWQIAKKVYDFIKKQKERAKLAEAVKKVYENPASVETMVTVGETLPVIKKGVKIYKDFAELAADSRYSSQDVASFAQQTKILLAAVKAEQARLHKSRKRYEIHTALVEAAKNACTCGGQQPVKLSPKS
jgi:hypothetical protein